MQHVTERRRPLRIALVGLRPDIAPAYVRVLAASPDAQLWTLVDPDPNAGAGWRADLAAGVPRHERLDQGLADQVDAVVVCVPASARAGVVAEALELRLPVLCPGPLAERPEDAERLLGLAAARGCLLMDAFPRRRMFASTREAVRAGRIGTLERVELDWRTAGTYPADRGRPRSADELLEGLLPDLLAAALAHFTPNTVAATTWRHADEAVPYAARVVLRGTGDPGAGAPVQELVLNVNLDDPDGALEGGGYDLLLGGTSGWIVAQELTSRAPEAAATEGRLPILHRRGQHGETRLEPSQTPDACYAEELAAFAEAVRAREVAPADAVAWQLQLVRVSAAVRSAAS